MLPSSGGSPSVLQADGRAAVHPLLLCDEPDRDRWPSRRGDSGASRVSAAGQRGELAPGGRGKGGRPETETTAATLRPEGPGSGLPIWSRPGSTLWQGGLRYRTCPICSLAVAVVILQLALHKTQNLLRWGLRTLSTSRTSLGTFELPGTVPGRTGTKVAESILRGACVGLVHIGNRRNESRN